MVELLLTVGYYDMLGYVMRGVQLDLDEALGPEALCRPAMAYRSVDKGS